MLLRSSLEGSLVSLRSYAMENEQMGCALSEANTYRRTRKSIGILPKVSGYECVIWMHPCHKGREVFVEATPSPNYNDPNKATFVVEPVLLRLTPHSPPFDPSWEVTDFVEYNMPIIMDFWIGSVTDPKQVVETIKQTMG